MPRRIVVKKAFDRAYRELSELDKKLVEEALKSFGHYLDTNHAAAGLGLTCLGSGTYEFRAGLALRVVCILKGDEAILSLLGSHDQVRKFLKNS